MKTVKAIADFLEAKQDLSPRTREQYTQALARLARECPEMPGQPGILRRLLNKSPAVQPDTIRRALNQAPTIWVKDSWWRAWGVFFRWCALEYSVPNPMAMGKGVERPKRPEVEMRALEPEQLALVVANARSIRDKSIVALALDSGVRASEFGRIRLQDVGAEAIRVQGKGNRQVRVPVSPETHHLLELLMTQEGRTAHSYLFPGADGRPLSRFAVYRIVRQAMDQAGISGPKLGPHCLRHSLGKGYIAAGGDAFSLQRIMRHRHISTTMKYVNLAMKDVVEQHHKHSPLRQAIRGAQGVLIRQEVEEILLKGEGDADA